VRYPEILHLNPNDSNFHRALACAILIVLTLAAYAPAMSAGFIWDDSELVTGNPAVTAPSLALIWTGQGSMDYLPLTTTTFWLEWRLFRMNPRGYHVDNVLLHAFNAVLIWMLLRRLAIPGAWVAALLFALHPVCVESAAWISERKNTLSMFFYVAALLLYLNYEKRPRIRVYALSLAVFCLALLSKGSVVMLPVILLLFAWWQRRIITRVDVQRSLAFFGLSAIMGMITIWFQYHRTMAATEIHMEPWPVRLALAGQNIWFYVSKTLAPVGLVAMYPSWPVGGPVIRFLPLVLLLALAALLWRYRGSGGRAPLFAMAYFVVSLLPVLGFLKMAFMFYSPVADHFQYLAIPGLLAGLAAAGSKLPRRWSAVAAFAVLIPLSAATWRQTRVYADPETLFTEVVNRDPQSYAGQKLLGLALSLKGRYAEANTHFTEALRLRSRNADARHDFGRSLLQQGRLDEAVVQFRQAIAIGPDPAEYHNDLGIALLKQGKGAEGVAEIELALRMKPDYSHAHNNMAAISARMGKMSEAAAHIRAALRSDPEDAHAHDTLGLMLLQQGSYAEAVFHFSEAVRIDPTFGDARDHLYTAEVMKSKSRY
jgi:protein O-mannosyl-transferase